MGSVSLRYPVISQPQPSPYYSFSDVTQVRQRINHPHPSPPSPHLYLSFRVNRGRTRYVHLTVFDSRVILPLESSSALRPKKKDRPFYPSYLVEDRTCPLRETVPRKRGNFKPSGSNVERCCFLFSFFFSLDENVFHPLEKFATFCIWILYTFILLSLSFALAI